MVPWRASFAIGGVLGAFVVNALITQEEYDEMNRNADCDNDCFFSSFVNGACAEDIACMCTQEKYREDYFCCLASCAASVLPDSLERQTTACTAHGFDMNFVDFDTEKVCGIKQKPHSKTTQSSETIVTVTTVKDDVLEASASTIATSAASSTDSSQDSETSTGESSAKNTSDNNNENEDEGANSNDKTDSESGGDDGSNAASGKPALYGAGLLLGAWAFALSQ